MARSAAVGFVALVLSMIIVAPAHSQTAKGPGHWRVEDKIQVESGGRC